MDIVFTLQQEKSARSSVTEQPSRRVFFSVSAVLFVISTMVTIHYCTSMSMEEMPMPGGWTMSMIWMLMPGQTWIDAAASFLGMWMAMMVAMMLPSLTPVLWRYYRAVGQDGNAIDQSSAFVRIHINRTRRFDLLRLRSAQAAQRPEFRLLNPVAERSRSVLCPKMQAGGSRAAPTQEISPLYQASLFAGSITAIVALGYFFVWALIGLAAFPLGIALTTMAMQSPTLASINPIAASIVMLMAGALQFATWKADQLACCRVTPCCHFLPARVGTAWQHGVRRGVQCGCCCAGLTAMLFVIGIMDLRAMAVVTAAITVERLTLTTRAVRIIGVVMATMGLLMIAKAAFAWP